MISRNAISILLGAGVLLSSFSAAAQDQPPDELTQQLFEHYVIRKGKMESEPVRAAAYLVAHRGRANGFWKNVLAELRRGDKHTEARCVEILGMMLARDAVNRAAITRERETGEVGQVVPSVHLGAEVVAELLERARRADRHRVDRYVIALAQARTPESQDFFRSILRAESERPEAESWNTFPSGPYHTESARFHAAVGLAQLGDAEGIDWLVAHCEYQQGWIAIARPVGTNSGNVDACCHAALQQLSGNQTASTQAEWEAWSKTVGRKELMNRFVRFSKD